MSLAEKTRKYLDIAVAVAVTCVLMIVVGIVFDYYYEFNDDVLMKDILSGAYTGVPEAMNIQMLVPISALLSVFYRIFPGAPIYGLFLCACHYVCALLLVYRSIRISAKKRSAIIAVTISFLFWVSLLLPHLVMAQYTITVAIMAATAAYIFYTIPYDLDEKRFIRQAFPAVIIVIVAFWIRSEMLLLMCPYLAIAGLARWNRERSMFGKETMRRYLIVIVMIVAGLGFSYASDTLANSSDGWKEFRTVFDNRTQLYDYQYIPEYEENVQFYTEIGLTQTDVDLLKNYNYGIDEKITGEVLGEVAAYAKELRGETLKSKLAYAVRMYIYRLTHFVDGAYAVCTLFLYVMMIWAILARRESTLKHKISIITLRVIGLFAMRSVSWIYIIMGHREPERITHSLYIIECVILFGMLMVEFTSKLREKQYLQMITAISLIVGGIILLPTTVSDTKKHCKHQDELNKYAQAIDAYCSAHPDNFYFEDVYSTIIEGESFSEKMFADVDNGIKNYDLIGGWACNSPLYYDKLARYGITNVGKDLCEKENVRVIIADWYDIQWIDDYYADRNISVEIKKVDTVADTFGVYQVCHIS